MPATPATQRRGSLALHVKADDPRAKGRCLSPEDVIAILPAVKGKKPSRWTVINTFLREKRHKTGRAVWWWERDVYEHLDGSLAEAS